MVRTEYIVYIAILELRRSEYIRTVEYTSAPKQIGESTWYHACREFQVGGFCNAQPICMSS